MEPSVLTTTWDEQTHDSTSKLRPFKKGKAKLQSKGQKRAVIGTCLAGRAFSVLEDSSEGRGSDNIMIR